MLKHLIAAGVLLLPTAAVASGPATGSAPAESAAAEPVIDVPFFLADALLARADLTEIVDEPVGVPDHAQYEKKRGGGRIRARSRRYRTRRRMNERRFGVALQPGYAMPQGVVVRESYSNGFSFTGRFIFAVSEAGHVYVDVGYSRHDMRNPRAMFFRTAVTPNSGFSGTLQVVNPAVYYALIIPIGAGFHSRSVVNPKLYFGMGPMFTFADGVVTDAGTKGRVTGKGQQPFVQFTPGIGADVRVMDHYFVGFDLRYRITLPTQRPNQTQEFSIPKMYVFEPSLNFAWMFY